MSDQTVRTVLLAAYDDPDLASRDYESIMRHHDLNHFHAMNEALIEHRGKDHAGKPRVIRYEESAVRGSAIGGTAGAAVGATSAVAMGAAAGAAAVTALAFPPVVVGAMLIGLGAGELIGHARHGSDSDVLEDLAEALPDGRSFVVVSTTDPGDVDTLRGFLANADEVHVGTGSDDARALLAEPSDEAADADDGEGPTP
jgi:hypothetical protein